MHIPHEKGPSNRKTLPTSFLCLFYPNYYSSHLLRLRYGSENAYDEVLKFFGYDLKERYAYPCCHSERRSQSRELLLQKDTLNSCPYLACFGFYHLRMHVSYSEPEAQNYNFPNFLMLHAVDPSLKSEKLEETRN